MLSTMGFIRGRTDDDQKEKPAIMKFYDYTMGKDQYCILLFWSIITFALCQLKLLVNDPQHFFGYGI
jgi:hypothetical protein